MFIKIQGGDYAININQIACVLINDDMLSITMSSGDCFDVDDEDEMETLKKAMGL